MCVYLRAMAKKYTNPSCSFFIELTVGLVFSGISVFMSHPGSHFHSFLRIKMLSHLL